MQSWEIADLLAWAEVVQGWPTILVQMPPPDPFPPALAFFLGVIFQTPKPGFLGGPTAAVFTLERTENKAEIDATPTGMLCGWTRDGTHQNSGVFVRADRQAFVAVLNSIIKDSSGMTNPSEMIATSHRTSVIRGRQDILQEFGISDDEFASLYKSYFFALSNRGAKSDWNDDITRAAEVNSRAAHYRIGKPDDKAA